MNASPTLLAESLPAPTAHGRRPRRIYIDENGAPVGMNLDLVAACAWKGARYSTVSHDQLRQPLLGFTRIIDGSTRGTGRRAVRYFPRAEVQAWLSVFDAELPGYVRDLIARGDDELAAHIAAVMETAHKRSRLPADLRPIYLSLYARFFGRSN